MDLRVLRYFAEVVEAGSVTAAGRRLRVAQPSLSRQLRRLEDELGVTLFDRAGGRLALTAAGRGLLPAARDLLTRADRVAQGATALRTGRVAELELVAPAVTINDVIAPYLAAAGAALPALTVRDEAPDLLPSALDRGADLVITPTPIGPRSESRLLARMPILAYVPDGHRLGGRRRVTLRELAREPLLLPTRDHQTRRRLDDGWERLGIQPAAVTECRLPQVAQALAAAGRGVAVVSDDGRFGLHRIEVAGPGGPVRLPLHATWERGHYADAAISLVVARLAQFCVERYGPSVRGDMGRSGARATER